ncbi:hypothetical protein SCLCIDRAFT_596856 [Scleroderma citrinum Foug A]|uniref:DUF6533 domain-containing protein n=1 Tax=Scleroderma citrinum Foug A TaxID=1036808 RepID=A0A0C2ZTH9_9AGAM|nr:hypothetical protein SCLCIDRAFT_596856 [Scleroderma citrinum Foug A]
MAANPGRLGAAFSRFLGVTETLPSKVIYEGARDLAQARFLQTHVGIVSFSILIYDHLITFADEVIYICPKHVASDVLFLVNRYLRHESLMACPSRVVQFMPLPCLRLRCLWCLACRVA